MRINILIKQAASILTTNSHNPDLLKNLIIKKGVIDHLLQFATATFKKGESISSHLHESMFEVFYVLNGEVDVKIGAEKLIASEGDTFWVPIGTLHSLQFQMDSKILYFGIEAQNEVSSSG